MSTVSLSFSHNFQLLTTQQASRLGGRIIRTAKCQSRATKTFLLDGHRLCSAIDRRLRHFLPRWLGAVCQNVISQRKVPWNILPWAGIEPQREQTYIHSPTELSWLNTKDLPSRKSAAVKPLSLAKALPGVWISCHDCITSTHSVESIPNCEPAGPTCNTVIYAVKDWQHK